MARPTWSGYVQISLVSFKVKLFPATNPASRVSFHELDRKTGERVHHQNITAGGDTVDRSEIVKGFEYRKGEYVTIEPEEIKKLRVPSKDTLVIDRFVKIDEIEPGLYEEPYFVVPDGDVQMKPFGVIREAMRKSGEAAVGKVTFSGREHLVAILPSAGKTSAGMMGYILRYPSELRKASEYFSSIKHESVPADQLSMAMELVRRNTEKFAEIRFSDGYEAALHALVEAKLKHKPPPREAPRAKPGKVINLMDALRQSIGTEGLRPRNRAETNTRAATGGNSRQRKTSSSRGKGITLVKPERHAGKKAG